MRSSEGACWGVLVPVQCFMVPVQSGDVVVVGTDGLFDNVFDRDVAMIASRALTAGLGPEQCAKQLASLATALAQDQDSVSPFAKVSECVIAIWTRYSLGRRQPRFEDAEYTLLILGVEAGKFCFRFVGWFALLAAGTVTFQYVSCFATRLSRVPFIGYPKRTCPFG